MKAPVSLCYAKTMGLALARNRTLWVCTIVIALFSCVFIFYPMILSSDEVSYDLYRARLANIKSNLADSEYLSSAPEWERQGLEDIEGLLEKVVTNWNASSRISDLADYLEVEAGQTRRLYENGRLANDYSAVLNIEGSAQIMRGVANLSNPTLYSRSDRFPPVAYLLYLTGNLPYFVWYIPLLIAITACAKERDGDTMLSCAPMRRRDTVIALFMLLLAFSLVALVAEWLPAFVITLFKNGPDDLAYPIAFVTNDSLFTSTTGLSMLKWTGVFMAESALFCLMAALFLSLGASRASQALIAVTLAIPMLPGYLTGSIPGWLLKYLPTTYLEAVRFTGVPSSSALLIESGIGCTFEAAVPCILAWFAGVLALGVLACSLSHLARTHRKGGRHA